jgi:hypothetical protein
MKKISNPCMVGFSVQAHSQARLSTYAGEDALNWFPVSHCNICYAAHSLHGYPPQLPA